MHTLPSTPRTPRLPVARRTRPSILTAGPEPLSWKDFDRKISVAGSKFDLATFIVAQEVKGMFRRPAVDPIDLGRVILKHARKRLVRKPMSGAAAVKAAGHEVLSHYVEPRRFQEVCAQFNGVANRLHLD